MLKTLNLEIDTLEDVVNKFNHNANLTIAVTDPLAGDNLILEGKTLKVKPHITYVLDQNDQLIGLTSQITLNDTLSSAQFSGTLQQILDSLASTIRQIKGTEKWTDPIDVSLKDLQNEYTALLNLYNTLLRDYRNLEDDYLKLVKRIDEFIEKQNEAG